MEELLEMKLSGITRSRRPDVMLEDILANTKHPIFPYAVYIPHSFVLSHLARLSDLVHSGINEVPFAATFAGMLCYSGEVVRSLRDNIPMENWGASALLFFFCSDFDVSCNFSVLQPGACAHPQHNV